jgi:hypothetical protein
MKVHVLIAALAGVIAGPASGSAGGLRAFAGAGGAVVASADGGDRWDVIHVCPAAPGRLAPDAGWELVATDEAIPDAVPCPDGPLASVSGPVVRLSCDGVELYEWSPGQPQAVPVGEAACVEPSGVRAPAASGGAPVLVSRRSRRRHLLPAMTVALQHRRSRDASGGHAIGAGFQDDTIVWIRLTWRLDELVAPITTRSTP